MNEYKTSGHNNILEFAIAFRDQNAKYHVIVVSKNTIKTRPNSLYISSPRIVDMHFQRDQFLPLNENITISNSVIFNRIYTQRNEYWGYLIRDFFLNPTVTIALTDNTPQPLFIFDDELSPEDFYEVDQAMLDVMGFLASPEFILDTTTPFT